MNYFKEAEKILNSYSALISALHNIRRRKKRIIENNTPSELPNADISKPYSNSSTVSDTYSELLELAELQREEQNTVDKIAEIDNVINQLQEENKELVTLWYIKRSSKEEIAEKLNVMSMTTVYNYRNTAVGEFALLYFGAGALQSI